MEQDFVEAVKWFQKGAEGCMGNSLAMNSLGWCYYRGKGVEQDFVEAVKWFRNAADRGNVRAMNNLGWCYYRGEGESRILSRQ